jgi:GNAT superfamily N-acetyltransferase
MVSASIKVRQATLADLADLVRLRRLMFESMGFAPEQLAPADEAVADYFTQAIPAGQFYGWLALTDEGVAVGSGGVVVDQHPPGPNNLSGRVGYIMNLSTVPAYRRQGIARRIMQTMLAWLTGQDIQLAALHATDVGRPLYQELGFQPSNEMRLKLN